MSKRRISVVGNSVEKETAIGKEDIVFYDVKCEPFKVYGVDYVDGKFRRIPEAVGRECNEGVLMQHAYTTGGRVRFRTDSPFIGIHSVMPAQSEFAFFAKSGSGGFDVYFYDDELKRDSFFDNLAPPHITTNGGYETQLMLPSREMREVTVNMPLFSEVSELYIVLEEGATVEAPREYKYEKPIVYYGSSITHGACASRPGCTYESIISRRFDTNFTNLGFAGSAKGERAIREHIAGLDMSVFVLDYDHNSPTPEYLRETHYPMYEEVRKTHPGMPIIMMTRPKKYHLAEDELERREIIKANYERAKAEGDGDVYLLTGDQLMALAEDDGLVDVCHPTDFGFASMAKCLGDLLEEILPTCGK